MKCTISTSFSLLFSFIRVYKTLKSFGRLCCCECLVYLVFVSLLQFSYFWRGVSFETFSVLTDPAIFLSSSFRLQGEQVHKLYHEYTVGYCRRFPLPGNELYRSSPTPMDFANDLAKVFQVQVSPLSRGAVSLDILLSFRSLICVFAGCSSGDV